MFHREQDERSQRLENDLLKREIEMKLRLEAKVKEKKLKEQEERNLRKTKDMEERVLQKEKLQREAAEGNYIENLPRYINTYRRPYMYGSMESGTEFYGLQIRQGIKGELCKRRRLRKEKAKIKSDEFQYQWKFDSARENQMEELKRIENKFTTPVKTRESLMNSAAQKANLDSARDQKKVVNELRRLDKVKDQRQKFTEELDARDYEWLQKNRIEMNKRELKDFQKGTREFANQISKIIEKIEKEIDNLEKQKKLLEAELQEYLKDQAGFQIGINKVKEEIAKLEKQIINNFKKILKIMLDFQLDELTKNESDNMLQKIRKQIETAEKMYKETEQEYYSLQLQILRDQLSTLERKNKATEKVVEKISSS